MNRKESIFLSILFISLMGLASIATYQLAYSGWTGNLEDQRRGFEASKDYTYLIDSNGTYTVAYNASGFEEFGNANALTVLQTAVNNSPLNGSNIFVKSPFYGIGTLVINKSYITIEADAVYRDVIANPKKGVHIHHIKLDTTSNAVSGVTLKNLHLYGLWFYCSNNVLSNTMVETCFINPYSQKGLVFESISSTIDKVWFEQCAFYHCWRESADYGFITVVDTEKSGSVGVITFRGCRLGVSDASDNFTFLHIWENCDLGDMIFEDLTIAMATGTENYTLVSKEGQTSTLWGIQGLRFTDGFWEIKNTTLVRIASCASATRVRMLFSNLIINCHDTVTLLNNSNTNWNTDTMSGIVFDNCYRISSGDLVAGLWNEGDYFKVEVDIHNSEFSQSELKPYSYLVEQDGSYTVMVNGTTGHEQWRSTNASAVINSALGNLTVGRTWQEKVVLRGNFTIDSTIYVYAYTYLKIEGQITLDDWSNVSMIANAGASAYCVTIEGGVLHGNRDKNDATSHGIYWFHTEDNPLGHPPFVRIIDVTLRQINDDAVHIEANSSISIDQLDVRGIKCHVIGRYGLYLERVWDATVSHGVPIDGIVGALYCESGGDITFEDIYFNRLVYFVGTRGIIMNNIFQDAHQGEDGFQLRGSRFGQFSNIKIRITGNGDTTHDAIKLYDNGGYHSTDNNFVNIYAGRMGGSGTSQWKYVIEEVDTSQYRNIYSNINGADSYNGSIKVLGVNSTYCADSIIGTIVTS